MTGERWLLIRDMRGVYVWDRLAGKIPVGTKLLRDDLPSLSIAERIAGRMNRVEAQDEERRA